MGESKQRQCSSCGSRKLVVSSGYTTCTKCNHVDRILTKYVVYLVSTCSIKCEAASADEARDIGMKRLMKLLAVEDNNVYIPKVAVMEADDDIIQKENLTDGKTFLN